MERKGTFFFKKKLGSLKEIKKKKEKKIVSDSFNCFNGMMIFSETLIRIRKIVKKVRRVFVPLERFDFYALLDECQERKSL